MTPRSQALDRIVQAGRRVQEVAGRWNAVDLSMVSSCVPALEDSAADLSIAIAILESAPESPGKPLRMGVLELQRAVARLEHLVDASAAFLRGAPGPEGDRPVLYQAGGAVREARLFSDSPGTQG